MKEKLIAAISDILSVSVEEIRENQGDYKILNPVSWDSLAHLAIMSEVEEILGRELSIDEMEELDTLPKILELIGDEK
jgi:acyl carrier protein